ncbi:hypothetical protein D9M68_918910 [compost metagenome]
MAADNEFGTSHRAVAPDFGVIAVIADDEAHLHALGAFAHVGAVARIPALNGDPRHDFSVLLNNLALVVHQDERVVGCLVGVFFVTLAGE